MATFGKRDLALLLPDEVGDAISLRHTVDRTAVNSHQPLKPKYDPSKKVFRHRPGVAPKWVDEDDDEQFTQDVHEQGMKTQNINIIKSYDIEYKDTRARHRATFEAQVLESDSDYSEQSDEENFVEGDIIPGDRFQVNDEVDEEEIAAKRAKIREKLRNRMQESDQLIEGQNKEINQLVTHFDKIDEFKEIEESDGEVEDLSEYESETDDSDEDTMGVHLKPIFVPKNKRDTLEEIKKREEEEELEAKKKLKKLEERKKETRNLVAEVIKRESEVIEKFVGDVDSEKEIPDDGDDVDDNLEFEAWKVRELSRIKRDQEERMKVELEKKETERRRNLTDREREIENKLLGKEKPKKQEKWKFLQKYYHKGVFYMDEEQMSSNDVRKRSYGAPTLEDKFDKQSMPTVMQVKNFGRSGQTKWSHLTNEDTTDWSNPWSIRPTFRSKFEHKLAGTGDIDTAGKRKRQKA